MINKLLVYAKTYNNYICVTSLIITHIFTISNVFSFFYSLNMYILFKLKHTRATFPLRFRSGKTFVNECIVKTNKNATRSFANASAKSHKSLMCIWANRKILLLFLVYSNFNQLLSSKIFPNWLSICIRNINICYLFLFRDTVLFIELLFIFIIRQQSTDIYADTVKCCNIKIMN